jgi:hypothetical protein
VDIQCCCIADLETIARERPLASTAGDAMVATPVGADGTLDHSALATALRHGLHAAGLREPSVNVHQVPCIVGHPQTGKTSRFIPR